ncbi:MAG: hypothetical protein K2K70_14020 [Lachnospiraceae bacterium]|nr:hypothetical protein [Lachnospiraceae bacterium]
MVDGIVGRNGGTMTNCSNSASISVNCKNCANAGGASVGGLSGNYVDKITKCSNSGNILVSGYSGSFEEDEDFDEVGASMIAVGLVPEVEKSVISCKNTGNVSAV